MRLTIPARAEYITLCRLALTGSGGSADLGGARWRPEASAHRGLRRIRSDTRTARRKGVGRFLVRVLPATGSDRSVDDGEGFDPAEAPTARREELSEGGLGIAISVRSPTSSTSARGRGRGSRLRFAKGLNSPPGLYSRKCRTALNARPDMLQLVNVGHKSLRDYASIATRGLMDEIRGLAEPLAGQAGGSSLGDRVRGWGRQIKYTLVPLMGRRRLEVEWRIIRGADEFFEVTKMIHNALQGDPGALTAEEMEIFSPLPGAERDARARRRLRLRDRPRPAARRVIDPSPIRGRTGSGAGTSTSRRRTPRSRVSAPSIAPLRRDDLPPARVRARPRVCRRASSGRRRSTRSRRRTWRFRRRTRRTSSTSSESTSNGRY